jgi:uncharacterized repeat protein (TIGR03803 family)
MILRISKPVVALAIAVACVQAVPAATLKTLAAIRGSADGQAPYAAPVKVGGALYGTTIVGGTYFYGTIYRQDPASGKNTTIYSFTGGVDGSFPNGLMAEGGILYGTSSAGGNGGNGSIFKFDLATGKETTLYEFAGGNDGSEPFAGLVDVGGVLFGTTQIGGTYNTGTVFSFNLATGAEAVVHTFGSATNDGLYPYAGLTRSGRLLYGTTYYGGTGCSGIGCGTVYSIDPQTGAEKIVHLFTGNDGYFPYAGLVANGHTLYGATLFYGSELPGEIFAVDRTTGAETTLYQFTGGSDGGSPYAAPIMRNGTLYGTTSRGTGNAANGTIYAVDLATGSESTLHSFNSTSGTPLLAGVLDVDGVLFGTTLTGVLPAGGALYSFDTTKNAFATLHKFTGLSAGQYANPGLIALGNNLYGATPQGGSGNFGAVLKVNPATGVEKTLYSFSGAHDNVAPFAPLLAVNGNFYGTTYGTFAFPSVDNGTVFRLDRTGRTLTTLYSFSGGTDGAHPYGALVNVHGMLWGTSEGIGGTNAGAVFTIDPNSGAETTVHDFGTYNDGWAPQGALVEAGGLLYGTTLFDCCGSGAGTIFQIDPKTGNESVAYDFDYGQPLGLNPSGGLVKVGQVLYGALISGSASAGVIFAFDPKTNTVKAIYNFTGGKDGAAPYAPPIDVNGRLYGTTSQGGAHGYGTVYSLDPKTGAETTLHTFTGGADGGGPQARLLDVGGTLYGTTSVGAADNRGTVFRLTP